MNPFAMMKVKNQLEENHPKAAAFVKNVLMTGIPEGTVIDLTIEKPGQEPARTNVRVLASDIQAIHELIEAAK